MRIIRFRTTRNVTNAGLPTPRPVRPTGWSNQLAAYGEPVRAVIESMQLGEPGDVQDGQSSTAMAHDDSHTSTDN